MGLLQALGLPAKAPVVAVAGAAPAVSSGGDGSATPQAGSAAGSAQAGIAQLAAFATARFFAVALIDAMKAHPQTSAIQAFIAQANLKLAAADAHAAKAEWPQAMQALQDVGALSATGKKAADDRQAFTVKLADVTAGMNAFENFDKSNFILLSGAIGNANAQAAANNYVAANATLDAAAVTLKAAVTGWVATVSGMLASSTANASAAVFLKPEIDKAKVQIAAAAAALSARRWSEGVMAGVTAMRMLASTGRMAPRRAAYEASRVTTLAHIATVKAAAPVADRGPGLDALLAEADKSASRDVMQFEAGQTQLRDIDGRCSLIMAAVADTEAYHRQRPPADAELAALDKHAAAARVTPARDAARKQLEQAAKAAAGAATAVDPGPGWSAASNEVVRVRADLAAAKALADGAGSAAGAEAAATNPADVAAMTTALQQLRADQAAAAGAPFSAEAAAPLKTCKEQIDKADKALGKSDGKGAAGPLVAAAKALVDAKAIQVAQGQFQSTLPSVEARLASLQALPRALALKGLIDPVAKALAEAKAKNKATAGVEAIAALRRAIDLAAAAFKADIERGKFDAAAAAATAHVATITDAKARKPLDAALADAKTLADAFKFGEAMAALKKVELGIDKAELMARATANPGDPAIAALSAKMTANGGGKDIDDLVQAPQTTDPRMIAALATGRFGVTMVPDTSASAAPFEAKNMKALCKTFALVPKDVKSAGSIRKITHTDSTSGSGAWFTDATVKLGGRPDMYKKKLGTKMTATDTTGATVKQLPADVDKDCQPVADDAEYVSFTALHEVGHGVDDAHTYMMRNGAREDHGGWQSHGAGVQVIADAVGPHIRKKTGGTNTFYAKPEDRKYVLDKLLNQKPARPGSVVAGTDDAKAYDAIDRWHKLATSDGIWDRQGDAEEIAVDGKTVYHEAMPREWVSYLLAARKKGLTGYQFRAPGEWFAELYAAYKSKMLGPKHPAREWLKKL